MRLALREIRVLRQPARAHLVRLGRGASDPAREDGDGEREARVAAGEEVAPRLVGVEGAPLEERRDVRRARRRLNLRFLSWRAIAGMPFVTMR